MVQVKGGDARQAMMQGWRWRALLLLGAVALVAMMHQQKGLLGRNPSGQTRGSPATGNSTSSTKERSTPLLEATEEELRAEYANIERRAIFVPDSCDMAVSASSQKITTAFNQVYDQSTWGGTKLKPEDFYNNANWPPAERKAGSGPGSDLGVATRVSLRILNEVIKQRNITSMIDVPCGDANWVFDSIWTDHHLSIFLGLDVALHPVQQNSLRFSHHINKAFRQWDATGCSFPKFKWSPKEEPRSFELVHVRDVLQHLPLDSGVRFLCNVFSSGAKVLATTTFPKVFRNRNIIAGEFYRNNLFKEPFDFPKGSGVCEATHPILERDETCIFDLQQDWVAQFIESKCNAQVGDSAYLGEDIVRHTMR
jgi:hypothetical protein